jgi:hypothetical protein
VGKTAVDELQLKLGTTDVPYASTKVIGDMTECADATYAAYALTGTSWTCTWTTDHTDSVFTVDNTITFTASATIYQMYLTNAAGTILIGMADFGGAKSFDAGDQFTFTEGILRNTPDVV